MITFTFKTKKNGVFTLEPISFSCIRITASLNESISGYNNASQINTAFEIISAEASVYGVKF